MDFKEIFSVSLVLFSVIDILGSIPIIIDIKKRTGKIHSERATLVAGLLMIVFLLLGESILLLFGVDVSSFAIVGAFILFLLGVEMVLGIRIFREEYSTKSSAIVPLAFPVIAGAGTITTIISLRAEYAQLNVLIGILLNLVLVYIVLKASGWIESKLGQSGAAVLRKVFGVILLAISVKIFKTNIPL
ncbi:MAG: MarC family protein [Cytophagales bacterium]|nr:MAG: MarC family protein [Cytophagales bacterium]